MTGGWRRQDTTLAYQKLFHAICRTHLGDQLDHLGVPESSIAANDEKGTFGKLVSLSASRDIIAGGWHGRCCVFLPSAPSGMDSRMLATKDSL